MTKRPMCLLGILLVLSIYLLDQFGLSDRAISERLISTYENENQKVEISGYLYHIKEKNEIQTIYLKKVTLLSNSKTINLKRIIVKIDTEKSASDSRSLKIGNYITARGNLYSFKRERNPGGFNEKAYYRGKGIYGKLEEVSIIGVGKEYLWFEHLLYELKLKFKETIYQITDESTADILLAMLVGDKGELDSQTKSLYQMSGITHILTISGLHISLLGLGLYEILKRLGCRLSIATMISTVFLLAYVLLTGANPSTMRAFIMFLISIQGKLLGRTYDMLSAISVAAILLLVDNPSYLYDIGFLLSFLAVLGIAVVLPVVSSLIEEHSLLKQKTAKGIFASLTIWFTTLPIVLSTFYEIPTYALVMNLLVLPFLGVVLVSGMCSSVVGMGVLVIGKVLIIPGNLVLKGYHLLITWTVRLPYATLILGKPSKLQVVAYYLLFVLALLIMKKFKKVIVGMGIILLGIFFLCIPIEQGPSITNLDVGQGDCAIIRTGDNKIYIVDGGSSSQRNIGSYVLLPYLKSKGIQTVDGIFISHTDEDHMNGLLELLELIRNKETSLGVDSLYLPNWVEGSGEFEEIKEIAKEAQVSIVFLNASHKLEADGYSIQVLHPEREASVSYDVINKNAGSMVLLYEEQGFRGLFTGDMEEEQERKLLDEIAPIDYLKVSHHGSKTASSEEFLKVLKPSVSVISCALKNSYGHPNEKVVKRLHEYGRQVYYTMHQGAVCIQKKGDVWRVKSYL